MDHGITVERPLVSRGLPLSATRRLQRRCTVSTLYGDGDCAGQHAAPYGPA
jgi:hypothetical protein